jgi:hypothetical protein
MSNRLPTPLISVAMWASLACLFAGPAWSAPVAYVERFFPTGAQLSQLIQVERAGRLLRFEGNKLDLEPGDQIFVTNPNAVIVVRYIANNDPVTVRQSVRTGSTKEQADLTVGSSSLPGLKGELKAWFEDQLTGADRNGHKPLPAASKGVGAPGVCFNETGRTDDPMSFNVPILTAEKSQIVSGPRELFVSWRGGVPPFSVTFADAKTGAVIVRLADIHAACFARLPEKELAVGRYRLTVTDANNVKEEEDSLFVVDHSPSMPPELRDAPLADEARQLYFATWLSAIDDGEWAFEAQQRVAAMDCHSAAVQDWLRRWGSSTPCAEAKR